MIGQTASYGKMYGVYEFLVSVYSVHVDVLVSTRNGRDENSDQIPGRPLDFNIPGKFVLCTRNDAAHKTAIMTTV